MIELGWKSVGLIELTALPSVDEERWVPLVRKAEVLLVSGGDALYLNSYPTTRSLAPRSGLPVSAVPRTQSLGCGPALT